MIGDSSLVTDVRVPVPLQYNDPNVIDKVKGATGNKISHILDTKGGPDTQYASVLILAEDKPGRIVTVLPQTKGIDWKEERKNAEVICPSAPISSTQ